MIYFDSGMSKSTNTVVYFDWKTVIYIYVCGKSMLKLPTHSGFYDLFLNSKTFGFNFQIYIIHVYIIGIGVILYLLLFIYVYWSLVKRAEEDG
jgi:hypothetical protein